MNITKKEKEILIKILEENRKTIFLQLVPLKGYIKSGGKKEEFHKEYYKKLDKLTELTEIINKLKSEE
jgi:hypothetical protein